MVVEDKPTELSCVLVLEESSSRKTLPSLLYLYPKCGVTWSVGDLRTCEKDSLMYTYIPAWIEV